MSASILELSELNLTRMETMGERARRRREELKLKQWQVVERIPGMTESALSQFENGTSKGLKPQNLVDLARVLKMTAEQLVEGDEVAHALSFDGLNVVAEPAPGIRRVPIISFVIADPDEDGFFTDMDLPPGAGVGYIPFPTTDPDAYAAQVKGDSMSPRVRPREYLVAEPNTPVSPGDDVIVRTKNGRKMVKQLLMKRHGEYTFGSINQSYRQLTISVEEVESVHFIKAIVQSSGSSEY